MPEMLDGRYQLDEPIGRGGMGEVWRGHDPRTGRAVAVKILAPQVTQPAARERFAREARAAAQIVHSNVVTVFDTGEQDGRPYLVMELLTGRSLADELTDGHRYGIAEVCRLMSQAASGLDAAHKAGVIHRDIKPANLHRTADGTLKIVDFGIAQVASETSRLTTVGTVVGTAAYLAPEQINGEAGTAASDLYALGCVAYELLCGQPPFSGGAADLMRKHIFEPPVPPAQIRPDVPAGLDRLIVAMLAKEPAGRPANAEQVRQAFAAFAFPAATAPNPTAVMPAPDAAATADPRRGATMPVTGAWAAEPPAPSGPSRQNRRLILQAVAGVAVIAAVALGVTLLNGRSGTPSPTPTNAPVSTPATQPAPEPTPSPTPVESLRETGSPEPEDDEGGDDGETKAYTPSGGWQKWLGEFDRAVLLQEAEGGIDPKTAAKAHEQIREAARAAVAGDESAAQDKVLGLTRDLFKDLRKGKLRNGPLTDFLKGAGLR
ncbi:serine/threonine-protein kinase [Nonomuraea dietziae]|uniref:non-specific serine/threonine protein kinase n=2 Tax=Nonomuraea dietziae TaxID=65515 RepID=A0A7W5YTV9_9ACTN|nr:serine/threonine-protein kinase [Nonomuraea dietziae]MBB3731664.1 serine/threonine-protein kinase [Nonomuraea dietziae]